MKKILIGLIIGVMLISSLSVSAASFTDVNQNDWYYETVTEMTEMGLFKGKGNNLFCPNDIMTKAEFLAVTLRILNPNIIGLSEGVNVWWHPFYNTAIENQIISKSNFPKDAMENVITRQEMADICTNALIIIGNFKNINFETFYDLIPDINEVDKVFKSQVAIAYSQGLIAGKDNRGTFDPHATLTRAEGATVLYRLVNESKRVKVTVNTGGGTTTPVNAAITIYEGQARYNRNAQEGDLFIKKDGTQIVLKKGPNGVLGEGQGVAPDIGLLGQVTEEGCESFNYKVADYGSWTDGSGLRLQGNTYFINKTTGEGYWAGDLRTLRAKYPAPDRDGAYEGEVSSDPLHLYEWDCGDWYLNFNKG